MIQIAREAPITEYLHQKAAMAKLPLNGTFELTPCCNMDCKMCYVRMSKKDQEAIRPLRSAKEWLALAKEARERGMTYLLLTGGEPFLRPDLKEILTGLHEMGLVISINSNGTLIDEQVIQWLKEVPPVRINLTLYGASNETYGRLCGNPDGFSQVVKAIHLLKEAGILVKLNCSVTPFNAQDLEAMFAFAEKEELVIQATSYMFPPMRKDPSLIGWNQRFSSEEAAYYSAKIEELSMGSELFLERVAKGQTDGLSTDPTEDCPQVAEEGDLEGEGDKVRCRAGKCSFWVTWEGTLLPCGMIIDDAAKNVFEEGFDAAWQKAVEIVEGIRLPITCARCKDKDKCKACAAMVMTESGNYHTVPAYRCEMAKGYEAACNQVAEEIRRGGIHEKVRE